MNYAISKRFIIVLLFGFGLWMIQTHQLFTFRVSRNIAYESLKPSTPTCNISEVPSVFVEQYGCACHIAACKQTWDKLRLYQSTPDAIAGKDVKLQALFLSFDGLPVYYGDRDRIPSLVATVEAVDMSERLFVLPKSTKNGVFEFEFQLITVNTFSVTFWLEGPNILWHSQAMEFTELPNEKRSSLQKISTHLLKVLPNPSILQADLFRQEYEKRPTCSKKYTHDLSGRWLDPSLLPNDLISHNTPSPFTEGRGSKMVYLPHSCRINYFSDLQAMQCLDKKRIVVMADSTANEIGFDLAMHLHMGIDDHWPRYFTRQSSEWPVNNPMMPGGDTSAPGCDQYMIQRQWYWPITVLALTTEVSKVWSPAANPCALGGGGSSEAFSPKYKEKMLRSMFSPAQLVNFTYDMDPDSSKKSLLDLNSTIATGRASDLLLYMNTLPEYTTIQEYKDGMSKLLQMLKPGAKIPVFMLPNPLLPESNKAARFYNDVLRQVARENGFIPFDQHGIQMGRLSALKGLIYGDVIHATTWRDGDAHNWERTPFTHVPVQVLLNLLCD
ncbi:UNVERIFIED_CONTAM: hypothetical protein HDU68_002390 [Siphonaria sp. JEL0065]|nr:hypothetical protein HDU68_002390 [Siphonaria sp. JEL0065]